LTVYMIQERGTTTYGDVFDKLAGFCLKGQLSSTALVPTDSVG
jgi:hypothetical protein